MENQKERCEKLLGEYESLKAKNMLKDFDKAPGREYNDMPSRVPSDMQKMSELAKQLKDECMSFLSFEQKLELERDLGSQDK